jgi:hypothetical protein
MAFVIVVYLKVWLEDLMHSTMIWLLTYILCTWRGVWLLSSSKLGLYIVVVSELDGSKNI